MESRLSDEAILSRAGMAKLADAADLKSADPKGLWGFESPSRHQLTSLSAGSTRRIVLP